MNTNDGQTLRDELNKANQTIKELRGEVDLLSDEVEERGRQNENVKNVKKVLFLLLEAEKKAEQLERTTKSDLAYDLWHEWRAATALVEAWVRPSLHVTITDSDAGIVTKYTINNL